MKLAWLGGLAALPLIATAASACVSASGEDALIHSALPTPLPPDTIVAEVEILSADEGALYKRGVAARLRRVIQGRVFGDTLILRSPGRSVCSYPFANGRSGYIIAVDRGALTSGVLVEPFPVYRGQGFRMPDGATIPEEWRRTPPGW